MHLTPLHVGTGGLPDSWAGTGAFPQLHIFSADSNQLSGGLPESWGASPQALPRLSLLKLDSNQLTGPLPALWSSGWPNLG